MPYFHRFQRTPGRFYGVHNDIHTPIYSGAQRSNYGFISHVTKSGILPWDIDQGGEVVFLFGQRMRDDTWSDFGGTGMPLPDNAIRRFQEQTIRQYSSVAVSDILRNSPAFENQDYRLYIANFSGLRFLKASVLKSARDQLIAGKTDRYAIENGATKKNFVYVRATELLNFLYLLKFGNHPVGMSPWSRKIRNVILFQPLIALFRDNIDRLIDLIEMIIAEKEDLNTVNAIRIHFGLRPLYIILPDAIMQRVISFRGGRTYCTEYRFLDESTKRSILRQVPDAIKNAIEQKIRTITAGSDLDRYYDIKEVVRHYTIENILRQAKVGNRIFLQPLIDHLNTLRIPTADERRRIMRNIDKKNDPGRKAAMTSEGILTADYGLLQWD